jgi:hypothetical protein
LPGAVIRTGTRPFDRIEKVKMKRLVQLYRVDDQRLDGAQSTRAETDDGDA